MPLTRSSWPGLLSGPNSDVGLVQAAELGAPGLLGQRVDHVAVDPRAGQDPGGGGAVLAGVEVAGDGDGLGRLGHVDVVEDEDRRLAAELEVHPLEVLGGGDRDLPAGPHAAGDGHHLGDGVAHQRPARVPVAADDVEHAGREDLPRHLGQHSVVTGVVSDGLRTTVLPAARAGAIFQTAIIRG